MLMRDSLQLDVLPHSITVEGNPKTRALFLLFGFTLIDNPVARQVFARR